MISLRLHGELNDFITAHRRHRTFDLTCSGATTVKHIIEAAGVPHTEVDLILANGIPVGFAERLQGGEHVAVYPEGAGPAFVPRIRLRPLPPDDRRFVADAHLGGLARLLRMAGFDTLYDNHFADAEIERIAVAETRIVLTRDRELLKRRRIDHGCYVHALKPAAQLAEILVRLQLAGRLQALSLCLECNVPLQPVARSEVIDALPPNIRDRQQRFSTCSACRRVFWEGSHWRRMRQRLAEAVAAADRALAVDESGG